MEDIMESTMESVTCEAWRKKVWWKA